MSYREKPSGQDAHPHLGDEVNLSTLLYIGIWEGEKHE